MMDRGGAGLLEVAALVTFVGSAGKSAPGKVAGKLGLTVFSS
jgi:hypothetical protein